MAIKRSDLFMFWAILFKTRYSCKHYNANLSQLGWIMKNLKDPCWCACKVSRQSHTVFMIWGILFKTENSCKLPILMTRAVVPKPFRWRTKREIRCLPGTQTSGKSWSTSSQWVAHTTLRDCRSSIFTTSYYIFFNLWNFLDLFVCF